jgi:hypothetical protein
MNANLTATPTDFVFRAADRMRIAGCTNAIAREGLSLSLQCEHEALLDHYLGILINSLRQESPKHTIEVYFPSSTDSLLNRFNEALASQSVEQATRAPTDASRAQIWIVQDAQDLPEAEIQLLARLIQNFPGANIRAILLMIGANASHNLSAFGRKILRWEIEAPNAEQAQAALDIARTEGYLQPVTQLLKRIQHPSQNNDPDIKPLDAASFADPSPGQPNANARTQQVKQKVQAFHDKGQQAITQSTQMVGKWRKNNTLLGMAMGAALGLSTLSMLWIQPEAFGIHVGAKIKAHMPLPIEWPEPNNAPAKDNTAASKDSTSPAPSAAPSTEPDKPR